MSSSHTLSFLSLICRCMLFFPSFYLSLTIRIITVLTFPIILWIRFLYYLLAWCFNCNITQAFNYVIPLPKYPIEDLGLAPLTDANEKIQPSSQSYKDVAHVPNFKQGRDMTSLTDTYEELHPNKQLHKDVNLISNFPKAIDLASLTVQSDYLHPINQSFKDVVPSTIFQKEELDEELASLTYPSNRTLHPNTTAHKIFNYTEKRQKMSPEFIAELILNNHNCLSSQCTPHTTCFDVQRNKDAKHVFSPGPTYTLSNSGKIATCIAKSSWQCTVIGPKINTNSNNTAAIRILASVSNSIMVGIATPTIDQMQKNNFTTGGSGWYFYCGNQTLYSVHTGDNQRTYTGIDENLVTGTTVGVHLNKEGVCSFVIDGVDQGPAYVLPINDREVYHLVVLMNSMFAKPNDVRVELI